MTTVLQILFFASTGLILFSQLGYPVILALVGTIARSKEPSPDASQPGGRLRMPVDGISLVVAAHNEEDVIADRVTAAKAEGLEVVVACDGCTDATAAKARDAGADLVLELDRGGKVAAQNAAVEKASGTLLAFADANSVWETGAAAKLAAAFADPDVAYACGQLRLESPEGDNQEGLYWRYEMKLREMESGLGGITAGNGAIYMVRAADYIHLDSARSHDGSFPFLLAKRGRRSVYVP